MKALSIIRSLLSVKKKFSIIMTINFTLVVFLFNFIVSTLSSYLTDLNYVNKNNYAHIFPTCKISSSMPLTDDFINSLFSESEHEIKWEYADKFYATGLFEEGKRYHFTGNPDNDALVMIQAARNEKGNIQGYSREYSEYLDTRLSGESPDITKDYDGRIPVIASFNSSFDIGDTAVYSNGTKDFTLIVTGKYTDDNITRYIFTAGVDKSKELFYTDADILIRNGLVESYEDKPVKTLEEEPYGAYIKIDNFDNLYFHHLKLEIRMISDKAENTRLSLIEGFETESAGSVNARYQMTVFMIPLMIFLVLLGILGYISNGFIGASDKGRYIAVYKLCGVKSVSMVLIIFVCTLLRIVVATVTGIMSSIVVEFLLNGNMANVTSMHFFSELSFVDTLVFTAILSAIMCVSEILILFRIKPLEWLSAN